MAASYFGTFPVTTVLSDTATREGLRTVTVRIVAQEQGASAHLPAVGSEYAAGLLVTQASLAYPGNGFAEIVYTASGSVAAPAPVISLRPGAPLIFGLKPGAPTGSNGIPLWSATGGQAVEVSYVTGLDDESTLHDTYFRKAMPSTILGAALPEAAEAARPLTGSSNSQLPTPDPQPSPFPDEERNQPEYNGYYYGFRCTQISTQRHGGALQVRLTFTEGGYLQIRTGAGYVSAFSFD